MSHTYSRDRTHKSLAYPHGLYPELESFFEAIRYFISRHRYAIDGWYQDNVAAGQTDVLLARLAGAAPNAWIAPRDGMATGVWVKSNEARTAGTLTIKFFKNGVAFGGLTAVLDGTNTTFKNFFIERGVAPFVAGDALDLRVTTTAGWTPITADIRAGFEVEV